MGRLKVIEADITSLEVDVIVNAANSSLLGGGGVDGAIHRGAGPELLKECKAIGGCPTGEARITKGYNLPARHIIHTVGPIWSGGNNREDELLAACYNSCFRLIEQYSLTTVAFPAISTGVYGFPKERAASITVACAEAGVLSNKKIKTVLFTSFGPKTTVIYNKLLSR